MPWEGRHLVTDVEHTIATVDELRALLGETHPINHAKSISVLDEHCTLFLSLSTFCTIATCSADGTMDVSPKGDPPGFALVVDDHTLAIPERPGNRRCDTFTNLLENPRIGLIFLVPGVDETLRVNGTAALTIDPTLLAQMVIQGHTPKLAILVHVEEAFLHCGKALKRGSVWNPAAQVENRGGLCSMGQIIHAHAGAKADEMGLSSERVHTAAENDYHNNVY
jgi:PPOX class probable FMN-dependent enzyme